MTYKMLMLLPFKINVLIYLLILFFFRLFKVIMLIFNENQLKRINGALLL